MKITFFPIVALTFSALLYAETEKPASLPAAAAPAQSYDQLVQQRLRECIDSIASNPKNASPAGDVGGHALKALLLFTENKNIEEAEKMIQLFCEWRGGKDPKHPEVQIRNEALFRIYLTEKTRQRLSPETKAIIEDHALELITKSNRRIKRADADKSFWEFSSTENFYMQNRRRYMQAIQVLRLADRFGPSYKFANETIEAHYQAWVAFWIRYFQDRAGQGTDMEIAHPGSYGECTVGTYYDLYDLNDSPELRELAGKFITLYWAEVAAEFDPRTGQRAFAATRNPNSTDTNYWARELFYTYGWIDERGKNTPLSLLTLLLSSYRPPEIISAIAHDPNRGAYLSTSRRALMVEGKKKATGIIRFDENGNGHFIRQVFYTPDYTLSTMALDPARQYHHCGTLAQTMGATFAADAKSRIIVTGRGHYSTRAINGITGTAVSIIARDPHAEFGNKRFKSIGTKVWIKNGELWKNHAEDPTGWFFTRSGDAYVAIRVADGYDITERSFSVGAGGMAEREDKTGHTLELKDMWAPIVIQMGRATDYQSFEAFQAAVKARKFVYADGKLTYESEAKTTYEYWAKGAQLPKINGTTVNLNPAKTFDSPFLSMEHGSNKAVIRHPGAKEVVLDFGKPATTNPPRTSIPPMVPVPETSETPKAPKALKAEGEGEETAE